MHAKILLIFALLSVFSFGASVLAQETLEEPTNEDAAQGEFFEEETPAEETPTEETPAEETPTEETPAEETPTEEVPAEETPTEEVPAEETLEDHCEKIMGNDLDALLCQAVLDLQTRVSDLEAGITGIRDVADGSSEEELGEGVVGDVTEGAPAGPIDSPLMQMMSGVGPDKVQCKPGQALIFKASNSHPTCVSESSFNALISRGWIASYNPSLDVIMEEEATPDSEIETATDEATPDSEIETATDETQGQNYTADLSEDVDMGAN